MIKTTLVKDDNNRIRLGGGTASSPGGSSPAKETGGRRDIIDSPVMRSLEDVYDGLRGDHDKAARNETGGRVFGQGDGYRKNLGEHSDSPLNGLLRRVATVFGAAADIIKHENDFGSARPDRVGGPLRVIKWAPAVPMLAFGFGGKSN